MDVQTHPRAPRIFSILNDNDCPSFVIRPSQSSRPSFASDSRRSSASSSRSPAPRDARPSLVRYQKFARESSITSADSPPALSRLSSASSKDSSSSMDSSPSPATPAYNYLDNGLLYNDQFTRQDLAGYLPSPMTTGITPFLDQQLIITTPGMVDPFASKQMPPLMPNQYPMMPTPLQPGIQQPLPPMPTPISTAPIPPPATAAPTSAQASTSPASSTAQPTGKKNKYPCPFAQSHSCLATFTTSGHAARHGKKHTGEKGVHCPVCNKAFTRKDNMKQHERTHKGQSASGSNSEDSSRRSKAAITKDAQKSRQLKKDESISTEESRRSSLIKSPLSEVTSAAPTAIDTPMNPEDAGFLADPAQVMMPIQTVPASVSPSSYYPPLGEEALLSGIPLDTMVSPMKPIDPNLLPLDQMSPVVAPPPLLRGFSDLDTLAQAAESFDTSFYTPTGLYIGPSP